MGYGLPVLVSDIPENVEVIEKSGYIFESRNAADLEDKLAHLLNNENEASRMGELSQKLVNEKYSWNSIVLKTLQIYEEIISKKKE